MWELYNCIKKNQRTSCYNRWNHPNYNEHRKWLRKFHQKKKRKKEKKKNSAQIIVKIVILWNQLAQRNQKCSTFHAFVHLIHNLTKHYLKSLHKSTVFFINISNHIPLTEYQCLQKFDDIQYKQH